eukprot:m.617352 g.617352  ORF g.617352 m.617352 type:complete len:1281 (-) comp22518_c0_seq17:1910-5752(-)
MSVDVQRQVLRRAKRLKKERDKIKHAQEAGDINILSGKGNNIAHSDIVDYLDWFFVIPGQVDTDFEDGEYLVRIRFSIEFPISPPSISFLTPNGRYHIDDPICLNGVSDFHSENWSPTISVLSILQALQHSMNEESIGIGSVTESAESRLSLAIQSREWNRRHILYRTHFMDEFSELDETSGQYFLQLLACGVFPISSTTEQEVTGEDVASTPIDRLRRRITRLASTLNSESRENQIAAKEPPAADEILDLFSRILSGDIPGVMAACEKQPLLVYARDRRGRTPAVLAAIVRAGDLLVYFLERGCAIKHHGVAPTYNGHFVPNAAAFSSAAYRLRLLNVLPHPWTPKEILDRLRCVYHIHTCLGDADPKKPRLPTPMLRRCVERNKNVANTDEHQSNGQQTASEYCSGVLGLPYLAAHLRGCLQSSPVQLPTALWLCRAMMDCMLPPDAVVGPGATHDGDVIGDFTQLQVDPFVRDSLPVVVDFCQTVQAAVSQDESSHLSLKTDCQSNLSLAIDGAHIAALILVHVVLPARTLRNSGNAMLLSAAIDQGIVNGLTALLETCAVASAHVGGVEASDTRTQFTAAVMFSCQSLVEITAVPAQAKTFFHGQPWAHRIVAACSRCFSTISHDGAATEMVVWCLQNLVQHGLTTPADYPELSALIDAARLTGHCLGRVEHLVRLVQQAKVGGMNNLSGGDLAGSDMHDVIEAACQGNVDLVLKLYEQNRQCIHVKRANGANAVIAAASTGNVSNCDAICVLVERGSALKYHELPPSTDRHHAGKLLEVESLLEELAIHAEGPCDGTRRAAHSLRRKEIWDALRKHWNPPPMTREAFHMLMATLRVAPTVTAEHSVCDVHNSGRDEVVPTADADSPKSCTDTSPGTMSCTAASTDSTPAEACDELLTCYLCDEELRDAASSAVCTLPTCKHGFHETCLSDWLVGKQAACPKCRVVVPNGWPVLPPPPQYPVDVVGRIAHTLRLASCAKPAALDTPEQTGEKKCPETAHISRGMSSVVPTMQPHAAQVSSSEAGLVPDKAAVVLGLRTLGDLALTSSRRADRIIDANVLHLIAGVCDCHANDPMVLQAAGVACLELVIAVKSTRYARICTGVLATVQTVLRHCCRWAEARPHIGDSSMWYAAADAALQSIAEVACSPHFTQCTDLVAAYDATLLVFRTTLLFRGNEHLQSMAQFYLASGMFQNGSPCMKAECSSVAATLVLNGIGMLGDAPDSFVDCLSHIANLPRLTRRGLALRNGTELPAFTDEARAAVSSQYIAQPFDLHEVD